MDWLTPRTTGEEGVLERIVAVKFEAVILGCVNPSIGRDLNTKVVEPLQRDAVNRVQSCHIYQVLFVKKICLTPYVSKYGLSSLEF